METHRANPARDSGSSGRRRQKVSHRESFWLGEAPREPMRLSCAVSNLRTEIEKRCPQWKMKTFRREIEEWVAKNSSCHKTRGTGRRVICGRISFVRRNSLTANAVLERFFDESGGMQLVLHAPFSQPSQSRLGFGMRKRFCRSFNLSCRRSER